MKTTTRCSLLAASIPLLAGCGEQPPQTVPYTVRDSAGVEIVENVRPSWTASRRWEVDTVPDLDISAADDPDLLRLGSPLVLADGRVAFFNGGACEVRFHGADGTLLGASGGCGEGPGEFAEYASVWSWVADSLLVVDRLNRVSVLSADGEFTRLLQLPATADMPLPMIGGVLSTGSLVLRSLRDPGVPEGPGTEEAQLVVALLTPESGPTLLGTWPGPRFEYTEFDGRLGRNALAFSSSTVIASGPENVFIGFPDRFEIRVLDAAGTLSRVIRRSFDPVAVEQRDLDWLMERRLSQVEGEDNRRLVRQAFRDLSHAAQMPAFGEPNWPGGAQGGPSLRADTDGNLWVFSHYRPGEYRNHWSVFSPEGIWLGSVMLPERFVPSSIGQDHVIGVWTDTTGFQHIRMYGLDRPGS